MLVFSLSLVASAIAGPVTVAETLATSLQEDGYRCQEEQYKNGAHVTSQHATVPATSPVGTDSLMVHLIKASTSPTATTSTGPRYFLVSEITDLNSFLSCMLWVCQLDLVMAGTLTSSQIIPAYAKSLKYDGTKMFPRLLVCVIVRYLNVNGGIMKVCVDSSLCFLEVQLSGCSFVFSFLLQ
jgi:hypothetical protein